MADTGNWQYREINPNGEVPLRRAPLDAITAPPDPPLRPAPPLTIRPHSAVSIYMTKDATTTIIGAIMAILTALQALGLSVPEWIGAPWMQTVLSVAIPILLGWLGWKAYKPAEG